MENNKEKRIIAVDFFCGAGGVTRGLLNSGIEVVCGIDLDSTAEITYTTNNKNSEGNPVKFINIDINKLEFKTIQEILTQYKYDALLFVACAPCQPFTNLSTIKVKREKDRQCLIRFADFVKHFKPDYLLIENVPGIDSPKYGGILNQFKEKISTYGYHYKDSNINAKYYGVPQNRNRRILIASKHDGIDFPKQTHGKNLEDIVSVKKWLSKYKLPAIKAGETCSNDPLHRAANLSKNNLLRIANTKHDGGNRSEWMKVKPLPCYVDNENVYTDVYGRVYWDRPAPTITTKFFSLSNGRFGHPEQNRALSLREGALLQTFPMDYTFQGSMGIIAKHIGNAVPVLLIETLGNHIIKECMKRISNNY
ncbi:DNA cytosine methyltransferase [Sinanaerobacter chloroacetimidivorans]|uniref:DNA (cytosine-5-)-methyltransferase n=1 Tax=Sinanaerobacter chloroacetimidivorans TaxID=2818044 RepID=A0A8J7W1A6_9FIRM|nr:DNA cytosine methyltransferase [Sinanaerobacter chloroacetimidivorans]MBR0598596.1 DNA cytosine methyltransferase [Sinanaerobacter chloroacetimidivorans]